MIKGYLSRDVRVHGKRICKAGLMVGVSVCSILLTCTTPTLAGGNGGNGGNGYFYPGSGGRGADGTATNSNGASGGFYGTESGVSGGTPGNSGALGFDVDSDGGAAAGNGGSGGNVPGAGSTGNNGADGQNGDAYASGSGGGGGGDGAFYGSADSQTLSSSTTGGSGGNGGSKAGAVESGYYAAGGGGGGGGAGIVSDGAALVFNSGADVTGGSGGNGGSSNDAGAGGGGGGGVGIASDGGNLSFVAGVAVSGGSGGAGGGASALGTSSSGGFGGNGGNGIRGTGITIQNFGTISGGNGGNGGNSADSRAGNGGSGGAGVSGTDLIIINAGTIAGGTGAAAGSGGYAGTAGSDGNAITFDGGTNTLELHAGSTITGAVRANGTSDTFTLGGDSDASFDISQIGGQYQGFETFTKTDGSSWTLTGTGNQDWTVFNGRLIGDTASLQGNVDNRHTVNFNQSADGSYNGVMSGSGIMNKYGAGTLTLTGTHTYTGSTTVSAGKLAVNGSIAGSSVHVESDATLAGTGSVGRTTIAPRGIHAPGNSIGTQTVSGNYTLSSNAILLIEIDSAGNADQVIVNGTVDITGSKLRVTHVSDTDFRGSYTYDYVIINNDGADAVTGDFADIDNKLAFYDITSSTTGGDGNDVTLRLTRNYTSFEDHAASGNQSAVAVILNSLPGTGGETIRNAILGLSTGDAQKAYQQLSGDVHASSTAVNTQINGQAAGQIGGRLAALRSGGSGAGTLVASSTLSPAAMAGFASVGPMASDHGPDDSDAPMLALGNDILFQAGSAIWFQAIGGIGRIDGDDNIDDTDYKWTGMIGGYDTTLSEHTQVGAYFGYADGESRQSSRDATIDTGNYMFGIYGDHDLGNDWRVSGRAGWTRIVTGSRRNLDFGGIDRTATADYTDNALNADIELAKGFDLVRNWRIEPYGMVGILWNHYDSFDESGAGSANLSREADSALTGTAGLGLRLAGMINVGDDKTLIPQFRLGWDRHIGPTTSSTTLAFAGTSAFTVSGSETDRNTIRGNIGFSLADEDGWSLYADYQPSVSESAREHAFGAGFRMTF